MPAIGLAILVALLAVGVVAGAVAAVAGFGIGSLLTPALALLVGTKVAVALTAIPHAVATAVRLWGVPVLRRLSDRAFRTGLASLLVILGAALIGSVVAG